VVHEKRNSIDTNKLTCAGANARIESLLPAAVRG
jgi:hypothetical protein